MIAEIRKAMAKVPTHEELGKSTVTFGQISGRIQSICSIRSQHGDDRYASCSADEYTRGRKIVRKAIEIGENAVPGVKGSYKITGDRPPVETHMESGLMKALSESVKKVTGKDPVVSAFTGYTDTAVVAGLLGNPNCMSYGPGNLAQAHKPDEYVEIADIERCVQVYRELICLYEDMI